MVSLAEANKDHRIDGTIHWDKFRLMGETIMSIMKFKYEAYAIEPDLKLLSSIADCPLLSEEVMTQLINYFITNTFIYRNNIKNQFLLNPK